jgi:hypothetical protein
MGFRWDQPNDVRPSLNNNGVVAFWGAKQGIGQVPSILTGSGGPLTTIAQASAPIGELIGPSVNDAGVVSFSARLSGAGPHSVVYAANGGPLATVADDTGPIRYYFGTYINNHGAIATTAQRYSGNTGYGAYLTDGGVTTLIAEAGMSGASSTYDQFLASDVNNAGQVAVYAFSSSTFNLSAIYVGSGGPLSFVAETPSRRDSLGSPSINDAGSVAYLLTIGATGSAGLYKYKDGVTTTIVAPSHTNGLHSGGRVEINNQELMAYFGAVNGHLGIVAGDGSTFSNVISYGDPLFGSTVKSMSENFSLNDRGDVAFFYTLASGRQGIALAVAAPEPAALGLAAIGFGCLLCRRPGTRRGRRRTVLPATS